MSYEGYLCLKIKLDRGVAFITIDHPPLNLLDRALLQDIDRLGAEAEADGDVRVLVFDSADPDFFIVHGDVRSIPRPPGDAPRRVESLGFVDGVLDRFRTMPKVSIARIEGVVRGGGSEFVLSLDMRFGAIGRAVLSQPEVALGIIPGAGGTQRLPRIVGRSRAMEIILGCNDFPAELAERYGYINRALPQKELGPFVDSLAYRIASYPSEAIGLAKSAINAAGELSMLDGLVEEERLFNHSRSTAAARSRTERFIELGGQTRDAEHDFEALLRKLAQPSR